MGFTKKYKNGQIVNHYSGKKKVIYDLKNLKVEEKPEYGKIFNSK